MTHSKGTIIEVASGALPKAKLFEQHTFEDLADFTRLSPQAATQQDYVNTSAVSTNCIFLALLVDNVHEDTLFEVYPVLLSLVDNENLMTADGTRFYPKVALLDCSGRIEGNLDGATAFKLLNIASVEEFQQLIQNGVLQFPRCRARIKRAPLRSGGGPKLTIVHAEARMSETPVMNPIVPCDDRVLAGPITSISMSDTGKLAVQVNTKEVLANGVFVLAEATKDADSVGKDEDWAVCNFVKDVLSGTPFKAVTSCPKIRLNRLSLFPGARAIMNITHKAGDEATVSELLPCDPSQKDSIEAAFKAEATATEQILSQTPVAVIRKAIQETLDELLPPTKKVHTAFGAPATSAA